MSNQPENTSTAAVGAKSGAGEGWKSWFAPAVLVALFGGIAFLGYMVVYRIPDIEKQVAKLGDEQSVRFKDVQHQYRESISKLEVQLVNVRANVLRLCMRSAPRNRDCEVRELVSAVGQMSDVQANILGSAQVHGLAGQAPTISPEVLKSQVSDLKEFPDQIAATSDRDEISSIVTWSTLADGAVWSEEDKKLKVTFVNGSAVFTPKNTGHDVSLKDVVAELNNLTGLVHETTYSVRQ